MKIKIAVSLKHIYKKYVFDDRFGILLKRVFHAPEASDFVWALKDINLEIRKGERVGLVGPNGSGKSTLLRIIAGITEPSGGKIYTSGKIVSLMKLDAGFMPDLSGHENIMINGMLAGMSKDEVTRKLDDIIKFAGIGDFINAPFYTYSDGMKFRLALSIALSSDCDILIIDEIFISGDIDFQKKIIENLRRIQKKRGITTIITSHIPSFVWSFADTFYALDKGTIKKLSGSLMKANVMKVDKIWRKSMFAK